MRVPFIPNTLILLLAIVGGIYLYGLRHGHVSAGLTPFPAIDLSSGSGWFIDWRLAALANSPDLCREILVQPHVSASPVSDKPIGPDDCGYVNAFSVKEAGGASISLSPLTCQATAALALWIEYVVQPEAQRLFGSRVVSISSMGTYSCRDIRGGAFRRKLNEIVKQFDPTLARSQHATANAVDIAGFRLANGQTVSVVANWRDKGPKGDFLHRVHKGACNYFRVTLGPEYNKLHENHLHLDRGPGRVCW
ncbi:MAG: extensin family protein [Hyphomicrobiaceae bacterium]